MSRYFTVGDMIKVKETGETGAVIRVNSRRDEFTNGEIVFSYVVRMIDSIYPNHEIIFEEFEIKTDINHYL